MFEISSLNDLLLLFQSCSCDLRRTLLTLQFLLQSSDRINTLHSPSHETNPTMSQPTWPSSPIFDAMYYSHLHEQWDDSSLKIFFDDLTRKYTSEYNQSHLLLVNPNENNAAR